MPEGRHDVLVLGRLRSRIPRRQRKPAHLRDRLAAHQTKNKSRLPAALLLIEHKIPNRRVDLHSEHPRQPQKGSAYPVAGFYSARATTNLGASLVGFVTALHRRRWTFSQVLMPSTRYTDKVSVATGSDCRAWLAVINI